MGNTVTAQSESKLVSFKPRLQPNISCKICGGKFQEDETIHYLRRQYWHTCCRKQESGEDSGEN
jgi:hypothetical protein